VWVDGQPVNLDLQGKIRLYNKAAHMVISEWPLLFAFVFEPCAFHVASQQGSTHGCH
jgi:hypothetical protein